MKSKQVLKSAVAAFACALALFVAVGCASSTSAAPSGSSESASASAESSAVSEAASSEAAPAAEAPSSEAAPSAEAPSDEAPSTEAPSGETAPAAENGQLTAEEALAQGYQVFQGTVHVCTAEELVALQDIDIDPSVASHEGTYAVLAFDEDTEVAGMSADGSGERTEHCSMLGIAEHTDYDSFVVEYGDLDLCESLDGQHVSIAARAQDIMFPSDVRLPIGEPQANVSVVLS